MDHSPGRRGEPLLENRIEFLNRIIIGLRLVGDPRIEMLRHLVAGNAQLPDGTGYPLGLRTDLLPLEVGLIQSVSQARWPELPVLGSLSGLAPSLCPKPALLQPISI